MSLKYEPSSPKKQLLTADKEASTALQSTLFEELVERDGGGLYQSTRAVTINIYYTIRPF